MGIVSKIKAAVLRPASVLLHMVYDASPPSPADGDVLPLQSGPSGGLLCELTLPPSITIGTVGQAAGGSLNADEITPFFVQRSLFNGGINVPLRATNFGTLTHALVLGAAAAVFSILVSNKNAAGRYFKLHNKATAPVATDVPLYSIWIPPGTTLPLGEAFFVGDGASFDTGLGWSWSAGDGAFTDDATASDHGVTIHYGPR